MKSVIIVCILAARAAAGPYAKDPRVAHLDAALAAARTLGPDGRHAFDQELHEATRTKCSATAPTTACAIEQARLVCAGKPDPAACTALADVVLTNEHAANALVDALTRIKLVRSSTDYHAALQAELRGLFALLAAEFGLAAPGPDAQLAARIDRFCSERDREVHRCAPGAKGCIPSLAWQRCAAGLVWYIAEGTR